MQARSISMNWKQARRTENNIDQVRDAYENICANEQSLKEKTNSCPKLARHRRSKMRLPGVAGGNGPLRRVAEAVGAAGDREEQSFSLLRSGVSQVSSPFRYYDSSKRSGWTQIQVE